MRRSLMLIFIMLFLLSSATLYAAERVPLGIGNISFKADYIKFTDSNLKDTNVDSDYYIAVEGYYMIVPELYLGAEVGYTNPDGHINGSTGSLHTELTYVPIELNLKYAIEAAPQLAVDFGIGGSYGYGEFKISGDSVDDWLFGGQVFADVNYKIDKFFIGINGKYQITEDFKDYDFNMDNWMVGGQIGLTF
jgi:Outer membrane protein beta-barrel domain